MDDTLCQEFFKQPTQIYHRQYKALRTVFVEGRSQKEVAEQFGFTHGSLRQLVHEFRQSCGAELVSAESPFFDR
ncbi:MAG: helix-turn-helix domain-containing protein [Planctomycetia bacterium]|nr:helix-turn-helix domain-containing protein [Planctomycetia bacterium]